MTWNAHSHHFRKRFDRDSHDVGSLGLLCTSLATLFPDLSRVCVEVELGFDGSALDTDTGSPPGTFFKILLERAVVALLVGIPLVLVTEEAREAVALDRGGAAFAFTKDDDSLPSFRSFRLLPQNRKLLRFPSVSPMVTSMQ